MNTEYEVKFLDVDMSYWLKILENEGATLQYDNIQRISIFDGLNGNSREYVRVRDEGDKITLTHKVSVPNSVGASETEIIVNSYETAISLLDVIGLKKTRTEEKRRIRYRLNDCNLDIDTWPDIPTYVEIESISEDGVKKMCETLGVDFNKSFKGSAHDIFRHYGIDPDKNTYMAFSESSLNKL